MRREAALLAGVGELGGIAVFGGRLSSILCAMCVERDGELPADKGGEHDPLGNAEVGVATDRDEEEARDSGEREGFQNAGSRCGSVVFVDESSESITALDLADDVWTGRVARFG